MPHDAKEDPDPPAAQIPLSGDLTEKLGDSAEAYAEALWSAAQQRGVDAEEMGALISGVNERFGVEFPDVVVDRWQEIFRNSGGFITIISEDRVLAGGPAPRAFPMEQP